MSLRVQVLFPASPPLSAHRYERAREASERELPDFHFLHPRPIQARDKGDPHGYLAGSDDLRREELRDFLRDPETQVAWFGRGGYGLTRLLRGLEQALPEIPEGKRWVGYSDLTALFAFAKAKGLPIQSIHAPMLCAFCEQPNPQEIASALRGQALSIPVSRTQVECEFEGRIWGGNLAVLASLCGTPWLPIPDSDQLIFLEDVGEAPYRTDRFLTQLFDSGFFSQSRRVLLGTFTQHEPEEAVYSVVRRRCAELGLKILGEIPSGHSEPHSPIFLDRLYRFDPSTQTLQPAQSASKEF